MELKLTLDEIKEAMLEHADITFPGVFNTVEFDCSSYSVLKSATFTYEAPENDAIQAGMENVNAQGEQRE